ncbi:MAG TPA: hypothetical protein ENH62_16205 [Marinobacter sp.]|uniref:Uncharacterized protein n=1 Tax=marine sediment metagenome TaxID=412755 RepID=A0A0F9LYA4_9ZZZZ|nr:hypothetical protein [Marinobacter sp.]
MFETLANSQPALKRGLVWCRHCQRVQAVSAANCLQHGWPKCCGYTMTIDSPDEQIALADKEPTP